MLSIVWCDRAKYVVQHSPSEVEMMLEDCKDAYSFIWLNRAKRYRSEEDGGEQVALKISAISAIEPA